MENTTLDAVELKRQAEVMRILANVSDLPRGGKLTLADLAHDGFGGMNVFHNRSGSYLFQREFYTARGRFADNKAQCIEEIEHYVDSGMLSGPDKNSWY
jgi:hypothetical protein